MGRRLPSGNSGGGSGEVSGCWKRSVAFAVAALIVVGVPMIVLSQAIGL